MSSPLKTHQGQRPLSFAFLHVFGSSNSLATKDPPDVCSLSCRVTLKPVSPPLQQGVRFFRHPHPHHYRYPLRCTFPNRERYEVPTFRNEKYIGLGACYRPGSPDGHGNADHKRFTDFLYRFGSSVLTTFACSESRSLSQIQISSPYQLSSAYPVVVTRRVRISRLKPLVNFTIRYIVGAALYSCP